MTSYLAGSIKQNGNKDNRSTLEERKDSGIIGLVTMAYVNNILIVVFASQFFGIDIAALAALYNLPYYGLILVLKMLAK